jgi:hypothetical protein
MKEDATRDDAMKNYYHRSTHNAPEDRTGPSSLGHVPNGDEMCMRASRRRWGGDDFGRLKSFFFLFGVVVYCCSHFHPIESHF